MMTSLRPYLQLIRLPNLPSAFGDVCLGAVILATHPTALPSLPVLSFLLLLISSGCLYSAGMVWNDYFDVEQDRRERPERPIPSGNVSERQAMILGLSLFAVGLLCAGLVSRVSLLLAGLLVGAILLYDGWLKREWVGPIAMGSCRFLNVLLGLSLAGSVMSIWSLHLAFVVGLYVVGVTLFARTEAKVSNQSALQGAALLMFLSLGLALLLPTYKDVGKASVLFPYVLVLFGFFLGIPLVRAISSPTPSRVQTAVKRSLMGLIFLDAILATALAGTWGLLLLLLLIPSFLLNRLRWLYAT